MERRRIYPTHAEFWPAGILAFSMVAGSFFIFLAADLAHATPPTPVVPEEFPSTQPASYGESEQGGFLAGISRSSYLLGDMGGLRTLLSKYGISLTIEETSEVLGNVSGGTRQGT